jgi:hypothetical protein
VVLILELILEVGIIFRTLNEQKETHFDKEAFSL